MDTENSLIKTDTLKARGLAVPAGADLLFHPDLTHWETKAGYAALLGQMRDRIPVESADHSFRLIDGFVHDRSHMWIVADPPWHNDAVGGGYIIRARTFCK